MTTPPWPSPADRARRRALVITLTLSVGFLIATLLDPWLWRTLSTPHFPDLEDHLWYFTCRQLGYLPTWLIVSVALYLNDRPTALPPLTPTPRHHRAALLALSATLGGAAAELAKFIFHRLRPGEHGEYLFHFNLNNIPNGEAFARESGYGLASSHAGVAFGAAFMLSRLFPRTTPLPLLLALACSITRLLAGAHFATDIYAAALLSYAVTHLLWKYRPQPT